MRQKGWKNWAACWCWVERRRSGGYGGGAWAYYSRCSRALSHQRRSFRDQPHSASGFETARPLRWCILGVAQRSQWAVRCAAMRCNARCKTSSGAALASSGVASCAVRVASNRNRKGGSAKNDDSDTDRRWLNGFQRSAVEGSRSQSAIQSVNWRGPNDFQAGWSTSAVASSSAVM